MSFEAARALWERADERRRWIDHDHGYPYETALLEQRVTMEMLIALKELLEHLRSALDYCARTVCQSCATLTGKDKIHFPIAQPTASASDFRALVGKNMPGVLQSRPDLVNKLAAFQAFSPPANLRLSELATLANVANTNLP